MSENPDITKYFTTSVDNSKSFNIGNVGYRQLSKNEEQRELTNSEEPALCTLFQSTPSAGTGPESFFDMISGVSEITLENKNGAKVSEMIGFDHLGQGNLDKTFTKPGRVSDADRSRAAWIPLESTRRTLISMVTSPPGTFGQDRDNLTMPGVVLEEDLKDAVAEALNQYCPAEVGKRKILSASDVTQDDRGLRSLIKAGCYRAAVNLTKQLLTIYGQGPGRCGHPSKHTVHSIQLWYTRLSLLVKLRSSMIAELEAAPFGDMERPDMFFQFYPELYGGRLGSLVPFGFRLLVAQIPMYQEKKHQIALSKMHKILATVRKMLGNLEKGLLEDGTPCDISVDSREEALAIWRHRETLVLHSIVNCSLAFKDYALSIEVMQILLSRASENRKNAILQSALGRILLQLGDVVSAQEHFMALKKFNDPAANVRGLVDSGLLLVADSRFKDALVVFEQASKCQPDNIMVLNNIAVCLLYLGRLKEAVTLLENGLEAYPTLALHESYLQNLCNLYDLQSPQCFSAKLRLLTLISKYRGDNKFYLHATAMVTFYNNWSPKSEWVRESAAELLGTFFLVFLGNSAVAEKVLSKGEGGTTGTLYVGYALGAFIGVLVSAGVSGAHLNPAVTLAGAFVKKVDWYKVPHYMISQYLGAFLAACCTYILYIDTFSSLHESHGANLTTAGIFATYPKHGLSIIGGLIDQVFGAMVLVTAIYAITDKKNCNVPLQLVPVYVSLVLLAIGCSIGINEGFAINPARDLAPRFFTFISCWGSQVFSSNSYWYIPIVGPHIGAIIGAHIYVFFVENLRLDAEEEERRKSSDTLNVQIVQRRSYTDPPMIEKPKGTTSLAIANEKFASRL